MSAHVQEIFRYGYGWLFLAALLERIGLPLLVTPLVVAAGMGAGMGQANLLLVVAVTAGAAELGDLLWYELGRSRGASVLRILCKVSLSPDSAQVEALQPEQVEHALDEMEMLSEFGHRLHAADSDSRI